MATNAPKGAPPTAQVPSKGRRAWYSTESLLAARVPIGFVMHIGAHLLIQYNYSVILQLVLIPLMWWELSQEFPNKSLTVLGTSTVLSLIDAYILLFHPEISIWLVALVRFVISTIICLAVGVKRIDIIIINYLLVGITAAMFLFFRYPPEVFIAISMAIAGSDCMQYFVGKLAGRIKIVPKISPNKSLEGYLGAFVGCNLIFFLWLAEYSKLTPFQATIYVNGMVLSGILGDLFISWWKRNHFLKDTSTLLLAHGGVLDRLDSHIAAWLWSVAFSYAFGFVGQNFTSMIYDNILILIVVTWTGLWGHFFARRLLG